MKVTEVLVDLMTLFAGLGVFLFGLKVMGDNLETVAGNKMRKLFDKISNNRFIGMGVGAGVTAVIQSSSATTVMIVGFVNAGVMTLSQAAPIIMGANVGTTITAQISSLNGLGITWWLAAFACVGAFMTMSKKASLKNIGVILCGFGLIFVGLELMSMAMDGYEEYLKWFFDKASNPFLLLLIGLATTALIQSSSATTGILISMAGIIPLKSAMFVILGVNMGTCITAALAAIGTNTNAKRAAAIHFMFNMIGAIVFMPIVQWSGIDVFLEKSFNYDGGAAQQIAMFHTIFNISTTLLLIPFVKLLVILAEKIIPSRKKVGDEDVIANKPKYMDERLLSTPAIAIIQAQKEIVHMAHVASKNLSLAVSSIIEGKPKDSEKFASREQHLNYLNRAITNYLVKISTNDLTLKDEMMLASFYHVVSDVERIGDYAENIMEYSANLQELKSTFSETAIAEIHDMSSKVNAVMDSALLVFTSKDIDMLDEVVERENLVDECKKTLSFEHIKRLNNNLCSPDVGAIYINLVNNLERISDHMENIAISIKDYTAKPKKTIAYVKKNDNNENTH